MRGIVLAVIVVQIGLALPAHAQNPANPGRSISEALPLFEQNHCQTFKDPAQQIFCGDPELNVISAKLNVAIQNRLERLANRSLAIEENAEWIRNRNSSCGIFAEQDLAKQNIRSIQACLLMETEERIEILTDPNFDCLATNTTAGMLICSDPSLALARMELNDQVLNLVAKLKGDDVRDALLEYERWSRERDRKCRLVDKDNVPLDELSSSEGCLAEYISHKTTEILAAKGDPKKVFGRHQLSPLPDADAVDLCVGQILSANTCLNFVAVRRVSQIDNQVAEQNALVTAQVEMVVLSPFAACSPIASNCTGMCWDTKSDKPKLGAQMREGFLVARRLRIGKAFAFQKTDGGGWRCNTSSLQPVDFGVAVNGP